VLLLYQKQMPHATQPADSGPGDFRVRWLVGEDARLLTW
jgi:hypothetical protein